MHARSPPVSAAEHTSRLVAVELDPASFPPGSPEEEGERAVALADLVETNVFRPVSAEGGPYALILSRRGGLLGLDVRRTDGQRVAMHLVSLSALRQPLRDYRAVCARFENAVRHAGPSMIETMDMARRTAHDAVATALAERLAPKVALDHHTARRFVTLLIALDGPGTP